MRFLPVFPLLLAVVSSPALGTTATNGCGPGTAAAAKDWPGLLTSPDAANAEPILGYAIPGLGMNAKELPAYRGLYRANNPGVDGSVAPDRAYSLQEMAFAHAVEIHRLLLAGRFPAGTPIRLVGMSMGGMILSLLATEYRHLLPAQAEFVFLCTSSNSALAPAIPADRFDRWTKTMPSDETKFRAVLSELLSVHFRGARPEKVDEYVRYRQDKVNGTKITGATFLRHVHAVRQFEGAKFFGAIDPRHATFIGGGQDEIFGPEHQETLRTLNPRVPYRQIPTLGHLVNMEAPELFAPTQGK